jgi:hypothetical protein
MGEMDVHDKESQVVLVIVANQRRFQVFISLSDQIYFVPLNVSPVVSVVQL